MSLAYDGICYHASAKQHFPEVRTFTLAESLLILLASKLASPSFLDINTRVSLLLLDSNPGIITFKFIPSTGTHIWIIIMANSTLLCLSVKSFLISNIENEYKIEVIMLQRLNEVINNKYIIQILCENAFIKYKFKITKKQKINI